MIALSDVVQAKTDISKLAYIYQKVFFDGKKPKLRMWLVKRGISFGELDDVETEMKLSFMDGINKYNTDKIEFEKYIWVKFSHTLLNYFQSKKLKKNSAQNFTDVGDDVIVNVGFIPAASEYDKDDFEYLFTKLTSHQATMCRLIYYNEWDKPNIISHMEITSQEYEENLKAIRLIFVTYLTDD